MAWCLFGTKPLSEPMLTWLIDIYMQHKGRWAKVMVGCEPFYMTGQQTLGETKISDSGFLEECSCQAFRLKVSRPISQCKIHVCHQPIRNQIWKFFSTHGGNSYTYEKKCSMPSFFPKNGLSCVQKKAIIWTNAELILYCWLDPC